MPATARTLKGQIAIVLESTRGIGLGILREKIIRGVLLAQRPNNRFATIEEIGTFAVFLASDTAASITGTALPVDGGWTAH
jgi:3-hydroxybutyrate dehydrogenase